MMNSKKVMAFHSYKGGTGKTTCVVNLAALYASLGLKVCLMDFDIYAPSLTSYFGASPEYYIHDLLSGEAGIHDVLVDYSKKIKVAGETPIQRKLLATISLHVENQKNTKRDIVC